MATVEPPAELDLDEVRERRERADRWYGGPHHGWKLANDSSKDVPALLDLVAWQRQELDEARAYRDKIIEDLAVDSAAMARELGTLRAERDAALFDRDEERVDAEGARRMFRELLAQRDQVRVQAELEIDQLRADVAHVRTERDEALAASSYADTYWRQRAFAAEGERDRLLDVYRAAEAWVDAGESQTGATKQNLELRAKLRQELIDEVRAYRSGTLDAGVESAGIGLDPSPDPWRLVEWQTLPDVCAIAGCDNTDVDQRGPVQLRDGAIFKACAEHWEGVFRVLGEQASWERDAARSTAAVSGPVPGEDDEAAR